MIAVECVRWSGVQRQIHARRANDRFRRRCDLIKSLPTTTMWPAPVVSTHPQRTLTTHQAQQPPKPISNPCRSAAGPCRLRAANG
jgi:hypothetical protein